MKKIFFIFSLFVIPCLMSNVERKSLPYKVLSKGELTRIEEEKKLEIDSFYIIDYNGVFVTTFADGTAILLPPVLGEEEGFFFTNKRSMQEMIDARSYPVKGTGSFWEQEKARVINIEYSMAYYCSKLSELLGFSVELKDERVYLKELSMVVGSKFKSKKVDKDLPNYLAVYIGELIRKRVNGEWKLAIENAFNVYYIPEVVKGNLSFNTVAYIKGELGLASYMPFDIESIVEKANDRFVPYKAGRYAPMK